LKGRKDIYKYNTNGFQVNPQNINRSGANRKLVSNILIEFKNNGIEQVTKAQVLSLFESLFNLTQFELSEILNDTTQPMINRIVVKAMLDKKGFEIIEKMLNRAHGMPEQKKDLDLNLNKGIEIVVSNDFINELEKFK